MVQTQRKIMIKNREAARVNVDRKPVFVGVLKSFWAPGPLIEAPLAVKRFNEENGKNARIIRPITAECLIARTDRWKEGDVRYAFPSPVGMIIAYEKPGKRFGSRIVFDVGEAPRVIIATGKFKGEKNIAIAAMDITAEDLVKDGSDMVVSVPKERIVAVPDFPARNGRYKPHKSTTVPHGKEVDSTKGRYLTRVDTSYVGFPICNCSGVNVPGLDVSKWPLRECGIAIEIPKV